MNKLGRRKVIVYGLVLAGALVGLLVDRLGRAETSNDSATLLVNPNRGLPVAASAALTVEGPSVASIFENSPTTTDSEPAAATGNIGRDAFKLTTTMRRVYEGDPAEKIAEIKQKVENEQQKRRQEAEQFRTLHHLKGTTLAGDQSWALVDDRVVRVGDEIEGFVLEQVDRYQARFAKNEFKIVLALPMP